MNIVNHNIMDGHIAAFVDKNHQANAAYKPLFISNNYEEGRKVISAAFDDFIDAYTTYYNVVKEQRRIARSAALPSISQYQLRPNAMQLGFIPTWKRSVKKAQQRHY